MRTIQLSEYTTTPGVELTPDERDTLRRLVGLVDDGPINRDSKVATTSHPLRPSAFCGSATCKCEISVSTRRRRTSCSSSPTRSTLARGDRSRRRSQLTTHLVEALIPTFAHQYESRITARSASRLQDGR